MNAASLHGSASVPVAATPVVLWTNGGGSTPDPAAPAAAPAAAGSAVTPADGQGFQPAAGPGAPGAAAPTNGAAAAPKGLPIEQGLTVFTQLFGKSFDTPIIAGDGTVYAPLRGATKKNGKLELQYLKVGTVDRAAGTITFTDQIMEKLKASASGAQSERKLVKVDDQYVYQTFTKGEDGKTTVTKIEPATEDELRAEQAKREQAAAEEAAKAKEANSGDWMKKLGQVSQHLGIFSSSASLVSGLSNGSNPYSGRPGATWMQGYILASRLNGKAEGKLLPQFMQSGPVATAIDVGMQVYGMMDMGNDIKTIRNFMKGVETPLVNPNAAQQLVQQGMSAPEAQALARLGGELRMGQALTQRGMALPAEASRLVAGTGNSAIELGANAGTTKLQTGLVHKAFNATDPIQDAGLKGRAAIDGGINRGLGALRGLIEPAMIAGAGINAVVSVMRLKGMVEKNGAQALIDHQQGRDAALGAANSIAFLGIFTLPKILPALGLAKFAGPVGAAVNITANVIGGVQMLDRYGLFGDKGFLNHDAVRAAFLIPPLTPIGGLAFLMKHRKEKREDEAKKLEAAKQLQKTQLQQQLELAKLQLQQTGTIAGAVQGENNTVTVTTGIPADASQLVSGLTSAAVAASSETAAGAPAAATGSTGPNVDRLAMMARGR